MLASWDDLLSNLEQRLGMYVLRPRLATAGALLDGYSRGRMDDVAQGFAAWFAIMYPAAGGYPNPVAHTFVLARTCMASDPRS